MLRRDLIGALLFAVRRDRMDEAQSLIQRFIASGEVTSAALLVRQGSYDVIRGFGKAKADTPFLLASITKPMTATGVMVLRDRKQLSLTDPVKKFIPEFSSGDRDQITIRHLLTHTSGLPDMLPENTDLRKRHAPLSEFVAGTCKTPLLFKPGTKVQYQSMGILLAATIAERITRMPFRDFLKQNVFQPLGMDATSLGTGGRKLDVLATSQVPEKTDWDWNSLYWRDLGAPWGGAHGPAGDIAKFLEAFAKDPPIFQAGTAREMITNQTSGFKNSWGLGWRLAQSFGRACSSATYGHHGSTGTVAWRDPASNTTFVLLTSKPAAESGKVLLNPVSDLISEAVKPA